MGSPSAARSRRRSAGQLHALAGLQREILATDPNSRRKYLRDFSEAFRDYESLLTPGQLEAELRQADVVLVGDYHALPASQRFAAQILEQMAKSGRQVVLGVETILARDQHILDEWTQREIDDEEGFATCPIAGTLLDVSQTVPVDFQRTYTATVGYKITGSGFSCEPGFGGATPIPPPPSFSTIR